MPQPDAVLKCLTHRKNLSWSPSLVTLYPQTNLGDRSNTNIQFINYWDFSLPGTFSLSMAFLHPVPSPPSPPSTSGQILLLPSTVQISHQLQILCFTGEWQIPHQLVCCLVKLVYTSIAQRSQRATAPAGVEAICLQRGLPAKKGHALSFRF